MGGTGEVFVVIGHCRKISNEQLYEANSKTPNSIMTTFKNTNYIFYQNDIKTL